MKGGVKGKERSKFEIFSQDLIYLIHEKRWETRLGTLQKANLHKNLKNNPDLR